MSISTGDQIQLTADECDFIHCVILTLRECNPERLDECEEWFSVKSRRVNHKVGAQAEGIDEDTTKLDDFTRNHFGKIRMKRRLNKIIHGGG